MTIVCSRCDGPHMRSECPTDGYRRQPESAINVKMFEFGRLIDDLLDASHMCEIAGQGRQHQAARAEYKQARERLTGAIRSAVTGALDGH